MAKYHKGHSCARARRKIRHHVYSLAESLARQGVQEKFQDALEQERNEIVGRGRYERPDGEHQVVYRNGYHKRRCLVCGCGSVEVRVPRLEAPYESQIVPRYERLTLGQGLSLCMGRRDLSERWPD